MCIGQDGSLTSVKKSSNETVNITRRGSWVTVDKRLACENLIK